MRRERVDAAERREQPREQRTGDEGEHEPGDSATHRERPAEPGQPESAACLRVVHDVDVDAARLARDHAADAGPREQRREPAPRLTPR
ncbi:hypothetical protein ACFPRL_33305 [Pseudoclavibacter helvolus]